MNSLRARLVGLILLAVGLVWLTTAFVVWREAHHEIHELMAELPAAVRAEFEHEHEELIGEIAEHLAKPVLIAFPLLALLLVLAVTFALRPLRRLANEVETRAPERLEPIPREGAPREVRPLIDRLNRLFADIERALENERRFTADAAHELRTPLAALKAQAQVALGTAIDAERDHALRQIVAGCDRSAHLVEQMLTLARLDAPHGAARAEVDLRALAADVLADFAGEAIAKGSALSLEDGATTPVGGDPLLLAVALRNLVANALRHTPHGGRVSVSISRDADRALLVVADDGPGIPEAERDAVLQRFRRGSGATATGSGLGLSIVQRIAELHGGELRLERGDSTVSHGDRAASHEAKVSLRGTVAKLWLPLDRSPATPP